MKRTSIAAILTLLLLGPAHAETAIPVKDPPRNLPGTGVQRQVCYYEDANGFTYHYVIEKRLLPQRCVDSIETPFAPVPPRWAVLLKEEREVHANPLTLCYYGLAHGRLEVERIASRESCRWTAGREYVPPEPSTGTAELVHEEDATTPTSATPASAKICFYHLLAATHPRGSRTIGLSASILSARRHSRRAKRLLPTSAAPSRSPGRRR